MDFFGAQDRAHRNSRSLFLLFLVAVVALIMAVNLAVVAALTFAGGASATASPELFIAVTAGVLLLIGGGSAYRTSQLRSGGGAVARLVGGRQVDPQTGDPKEQMYRNVVEEMAIASGVPVPEIYILDQERGINAFAAGHTQHDAAVAVTRGAIEQLDRDELQGVVAHEFSHILNGDMRLNLRLVGILFGILLLAVTGRGLLRASRGGRGKGKGQLQMVGLALLLIGYIGVFIGRLIQAAVSRQREFLADASAVQFTRNPSGIAGALKKIGGDSSMVQDHHAQEVAHLFFADGLRKGISGAMATHPPLAERIRRLDPHGRAGTEKVRIPTPPSAVTSKPPSPGGMDLVSSLSPTGGAPASALPLASIQLTELAGSPTSEHLILAKEILSQLPEEIREGARTPDGAIAIVLGVLMSGPGVDSELAAGIVARELSPEIAMQARRWGDLVLPLGAAARLPLVDLSLPALHGLPELRARALHGAASRVILLDEKVLPFEFAIYHILRRHLPLGRRPERHRPGRALSKDGIAVVLSAVAWSGSEKEDDASASLEAGALRLEMDLGTIRPRSAANLGEVDAALGMLEESPPQMRKRLLDAAQAAVEADRQIHTEEAEMLRALAEALGIPIPPLSVGR